MLILLPPSEGKTGPARGRPLDLGSLSFPELTEARSRLLDELARVSASPDALEVLRVGESLADEVHANAGLRTAPAGPASRVYSGVLFDALSYPTLSDRGRRRAQACVLIFSALFGVLRPGDRIPAYRFSGGTTLPGVGTPASFWRPRLDAALDAHGVLVDCRSSTYSGFWTPPGALAVRVFREQAGRRTVVSHMAKHARGLVARALLEAAGPVRSPEAAAEAAAVWFAEHRVTTAAGAPVTMHVELTPTSLDVVTD